MSRWQYSTYLNDGKPIPTPFYRGWEGKRPSSFPWKQGDLNVPTPLGFARLYYSQGWTAVILWDSSAYFADRILTFDEMIELSEVHIKVLRIHSDAA
jgi:hypothetical protein